MPCSALMLPPHATTISQHLLVERLGLGRSAGDVHVDVAVAHVTELPGDRRARPSGPRGARGHELGEPAIGTVTSNLCGTPTVPIAAVCSSR
jgi:hypothetical protein